VPTTQKGRVLLHVHPPDPPTQLDDDDGDDDDPFTASSLLPLLPDEAAADDADDDGDDPFAASSPLPLPPGEAEADEENGPESVILHLAHQLHSFQGCSSEAHEEQREAHLLYHEEADIHPHCHSLPQITDLIEGTSTPGSEPLPDVLGNPGLMGRVPLPKADFEAIFEGRVMEEALDDEPLPLPPLALQSLAIASTSSRSRSSTTSSSSSMPSISRLISQA
jgi:hypothetical protein